MTTPPAPRITSPICAFQSATLWAPSAPDTIPTPHSSSETRKAPRRSPRPSTRLRRAMKAAAPRSTSTTAKKIACRMSLAVGQACDSIRSGRVQGHTISNHAGRPRCAAASMRTLMSGRPGQDPSHAARVST